MEHDTPLITTVAVGLGVAFIFGALANRLKISPIVGYLLAGVLVGPATPGYVADVTLAPELAELGVILLMFGVGLHFSLKDLLSVKAIAITGALGRIAVITPFGMVLAWFLGWSFAAGLVFGLALSVASTVVLLRALQERHLLDTERGRIAVGWVIVEDLVTILALVLLPALADFVHIESSVAAGESQWNAILLAIGLTLGKVTAFVVLMLVVGRRVIPWILHAIAHTGSRELFRLAVLAIALGMAFGASTLFGVSFALGAFFAGVILSESALSQQAAQEALPFRDAFAVLFFVSVGMLFDPIVLVEQPIPVILTVLIIIVGKAAAAYLIIRAFGYGKGVATTISASLAQIGEFSFIFAALGLSLDIFPETGQDLIVAGAMVSILLNPVLFDLLARRRKAIAMAALPADAAPEPVAPIDTVSADMPPPQAAEQSEAQPDQDEDDEAEGLIPTTRTDHAVLVGYGRVGGFIGAALKERGDSFLVIEDRPSIVEAVRAEGIEAFIGNAADEALLHAANIAGAKWLFVAIPDAFEAGNIIESARAANPDLIIIGRAHSQPELDHLAEKGASTVILGERETARGMLAFVVRPDQTLAESSAPAVA